MAKALCPKTLTYSEWNEKKHDANSYFQGYDVALVVCNAGAKGAGVCSSKINSFPLSYINT